MNNMINWIKKTNYIKSFKKINLHLLTTSIFDILFLLVILLILVFASWTFYFMNNDIANVYPNLLTLMPSANNDALLTTELTESIDSNISMLKSYLIKSTLLIIVTSLLLILNASLLKSIIWLRIKGEKISKKLLFYNTKVSFIWYISWIILTILFFLLFNKTVLPYILIIELLLFIYLTCVFRTISEKTLLAHYKKSFITATKKCYLFIIPIILILISFLITNLILSLLTILPVTLFGIIYTLFILIFINWCRAYFALLIS